MAKDKKNSNQPKPAGRPPGVVLSKVTHGPGGMEPMPVKLADKFRAVLGLTAEVPDSAVYTEALERLRNM